MQSRSSPLPTRPPSRCLRRPQLPAAPLLLASAWLLLSSQCPACAASSAMIATSSVSYCSSPMAIVVDTFDVRYSKLNSSLEFDLSAASVTSGLSLGAQLELNAYGINALNLSLDLCSVLSGVLCPLPTYNFTGSGEYSIPQANIPSIPSLAWSVPDIEAVFTVQLLDNSTRAEAACLQVTLTNGLTVGLPSVVWASAAFLILPAILAFATAVLAPAEPRLTVPGSLFYLIGNQLQQMAMAGMLSLNYPTVLRTWTTNFGYAVGLISNRAVSRAIDRLRDRTGGNGFRTAQDPVAFISRLYSPYNQISGSVDTHTTTTTSARALFSVDTLNQLVSSATETNRSAAPYALLASGAAPGQFAATTAPKANYVMPVVTQNTTLLDPGLAAYVNQVGFPVENAYMVLFMWLLILAAFAAGLFGLAAIARVLTHRRWPLAPAALAVLLRVLLFAYPPLSLFTFWQWRLGKADAWVPILFSVLLWLASTAALAVVFLRLLRHHQDRRTWTLAPVVVGMFKPTRWWLLGPLMLISLLRVAFIGFGQGSGQTQVASEIVLLAIQLGLLVIYRPFGRALTNLAAILQAVLALLQTAILQALVPALGVKPIPRAVLGFVMIAVHSIGLLGVLVFGLWPLAGEIREVLRERRREREEVGVLMGVGEPKFEKPGMGVEVGSDRSRTSTLLEQPGGGPLVNGHGGSRMVADSGEGERNEGRRESLDRRGDEHLK